MHIEQYKSNIGMEIKPQLYTRGEIRELKATASPF